MPSDARELPHRPLDFMTHVLPAGVYACGVFYAGLVQMGPLPELGFVATDKLLHALVFGGLALLLARMAHYFRASASLAKKLLLGCAGASLLGLLLEVFQSFTVYRSADALDWLADTVGAVLAAGLAFVFLARFPRRAHG